jgi:hypothetical protein
MKLYKGDSDGDGEAFVETDPDNYYLEMISGNVDFFDKYRRKEISTFCCRPLGEDSYIP